jgi:hypothetical protein
VTIARLGRFNHFATYLMNHFACLLPSDYLRVAGESLVQQSIMLDWNFL